jgi:RNA polymerase sigma-70 factor, ECF subfamily
MKTILDDLPSSYSYWHDPAESETTLVPGAGLGELDAFNLIILKYQDVLYRTALGILGREELAEDAVQESVISAYQHLDQFRGGSLKSWLVQIVINKCYDAARRRQKHVTVSLNEMYDDQDENENEQLYARLQDQPASLETDVETRQMRDSIQACLSSLPVDFRIIVVLVDIEEISYVEASTVLNIPVGTVKSRLARARGQLRQKLKEHGGLGLQELFAG